MVTALDEGNRFGTQEQLILVHEVQYCSSLYLVVSQSSSMFALRLLSPTCKWQHLDLSHVNIRSFNERVSFSSRYLLYTCLFGLSLRNTAIWVHDGDHR